MKIRETIIRGGWKHGVEETEGAIYDYDIDFFGDGLLPTLDAFVTDKDVTKITIYKTDNLIATYEKI